MSSAAQSCLSGLRIGCVRYLNSRPLIAGLTGVRLEHPSVLARVLRSGELDVALVPVFEAIQSPAGRYEVVDGVGIASRGPVYSVFVAHRGPLEEVRQVVADPASLTSVHLMQVLFRMHSGRPLEVVPEEHASAEQLNAARLWIGNQAIAYRESVSAGEDVRFWDLGEAWTALTGLPFVYALWVMRSDAIEGRSKAVADAFREVARCGIEQRKAIAAEEAEFGRDFAWRYLTEHIHFEIRDFEKAGLGLFSSGLEKAGFVSGGRPPLVWV